MVLASQPPFEGSSKRTCFSLCGGNTFILFARCAIVRCMNWIEERDTMSVINQAQLMTESNDTDLYNYLITLIKQAVATYLANEHIDYDVDTLSLNLSFSAQASFGDYSLPVMPWAGKKALG